ncbi:hypothetical protein RUM43_005769 [Polyplax serrata]|uniref:Smoothelin domain-containing protein n=1 Tax=Polyplax serrata TaxID=468196 RepID=A0AAN8PA12_POLSC
MEIITTTTETYTSGDDIDNIWDEKKLRQLLDACGDYEGRRKLRARLRTVMAEKSACEDLVTAAQAERDADNNHRQVQGVRMELTWPPIEDSGTESGEDFRLLAGLRNSIRDHQENEADSGFLTELHKNLKTLQATLDSRLAVGKTLDPDTRDNLLDLVVHLQDSLKKTSENAKPSQEVKSNKNRFLNRRMGRQNRHTVGVTAKELADARRLLEENAENQCPEVPDVQNCSDTTQNREHFPEQTELINLGGSSPGSLCKQNSVGDLINNPLYKPFRSVQFNPVRNKVMAPTSGNAMAKPYSSSFDSAYGDGPFRSCLTSTQPTAECSDTPPAVPKYYNGENASFCVNPKQQEGLFSDHQNDPYSRASHQNLVYGGNSGAKPNCSPRDKRSSLIEPRTNSFNRETIEMGGDRSVAKDVSLERNMKNRLSIDSDLASSDDDMPNDEEDTYSESEEEKISVKQSSAYQTEPRMAPVGHSHSQSVFQGHPTIMGSTPPQPTTLVNHRNNGIPRVNTVERRIQELQSDSRHQNRPKGRSIEELQKTYRERKEKDMENRKSRQMLKEQLKLKDSWVNQEVHGDGYDHQTHPGYVPKLEDGSNSRLRRVPTNCDFEYGETVDGSQTESELSVSSTSTESGVSHAQKLLQMATNEHQPGRIQNKLGKRFKMKRSNTIDIPKPFNYYEVEGDTDYSDTDDRRGGQLTSSGAQAKGCLPPQLEPKTESDRRFIAFLAKRSQPVMPNTIWRKDNRNSCENSADQWENRFSRIKTAFEKPLRRSGEDVKPGFGASVARGGKSGMQSADDSTALLASKGEFYAAGNGPRLSKEGSRFLRRLFEQKDTNEKPSKLPWTSSGPENENVVVGSLTVGSQKSVDLVSPVSPLLKPSTAVNQFRHAPMSAFKPVQRKSTPNIAQSFAASGPLQKINPFKQCMGNPQENHAENKNPILPWVKDNGVTHSEKSVNSTLAKFENLSGTKQHVNLSHPRNVYPNSGISPLLHKSPSQPSLAHSKFEFSPYVPPLKMNQFYQQSPPEAVQYDASSVKKKVQNFQNPPVDTPEVKYRRKSVDMNKPSFKPITTYSVDVAATSTVYGKGEESPVDSFYQQLSDADTTISTPEEHPVAVTRIMGSANQQQAVTVQHKTQWKDDGSNDTRSSAVKNLTNSLQRFSIPSEQSGKPLSSTRGSTPGSTPSRSPLLPPKLPTGKISPGNQSTGHKSPTSQSNPSLFPMDIYRSGDRTLPRSISRRTSSAESLVTASRSEEVKENGEAVVTSKLQIPYRVPPLQSTSPREVSPGESLSKSPDAQMFLQRSESCHQIRAKRPQSLIVSNVPNLPAPQRRTPNPLIKTKSSHALGFGGSQFEAAINQATLGTKQKTVEEYLMQKSPGSRAKVQKRQTKTEKTSDLVDLDDNLDNVDEAFDALFSSVSSEVRHEGKFQRVGGGKQLIKSMSAHSLEQNRVKSDSALPSRTEAGTSSNTSRGELSNRNRDRSERWREKEREGERQRAILVL